jgi:hypothetical protein
MPKKKKSRCRHFLQQLNKNFSRFQTQQMVFWQLVSYAAHSSQISSCFVSVSLLLSAGGRLPVLHLCLTASYHHHTPPPSPSGVVVRTATATNTTTTHHYHHLPPPSPLTAPPPYRVALSYWGGTELFKIKLQVTEYAVVLIPVLCHQGLLVRKGKDQNFPAL